jgi:hypothetical protein
MLALAESGYVDLPGPANFFVIDNEKSVYNFDTRLHNPELRWSSFMSSAWPTSCEGPSSSTASSSSRAGEEKTSDLQDLKVIKSLFWELGGR